MSNDNETLRKELAKARDNSLRQIGILEAGPPNGGTWAAKRSEIEHMIATSQAQLAKIDEMLAALDRGEALPERPKKGERYVVVSEFETGVLTMWRAPFTGGGRKILPRGLTFVVAFDPPVQAIGVSADAIDYAKWEPLLVDAADLAAPKYAGYYLVVKYDDLTAHCERLESDWMSSTMATTTGLCCSAWAVARS